MDADNFQVCDLDLPASLLEHYLQADAIACDTETMGLLPARDRLCLVQLCNPSGFVAVVRIERDQRAAPNLKKLLETPHILKIFVLFQSCFLQYINILYSSSVLYMQKSNKFF